MTRAAGLALLLLGLAGCRQLLGLHDLDVDGSTGLPSDGSLDTPASDGTVDAPPGSGSDRDGDGVPDAVDNCPTVANADQRDWDGDHIGDACDHCPHLASTTDPDTDGDGVGDACDPNPTTAGDTRVLFEGFYDDATVGSGSGAWIAASGTWSVSNHQLHQTDATANLATLRPAVLVTHPYLATQIHIDTLGTMDQGIRPGVGTDEYGSMGAVTVGCYIFGDPNHTGQQQVGSTQNGMIVASMPWSGSDANGETIQLLERIDTSNTCNAFEGSAARSSSTTTSTGSGALAVTTGLAAASFDYVFLVAMGSGTGTDP